MEESNEASKDATKKFDNEIENAWQKAYHSEKGGGNEWIELEKVYGAISLTEEEKRNLSAGEMKITKGAYPVQLRRVFEKIKEKYSGILSLLSGEEKEKLSFALNSFDSDKKVMEYYSKIKPFSGIGDIFKNSAIGTQKYSTGLKAEKHFTIKCKNCGSPRLEEDNVISDECLFCGSILFERI
ncbi:hypothetical protein BH10BAC5_BH10BAC5_02110 [soil metagenome]